MLYNTLIKIAHQSTYVILLWLLLLPLCKLLSSLSFFLTSLEMQDETREAQRITFASASHNFLLGENMQDQTRHVCPDRTKSDF